VTASAFARSLPDFTRHTTGRPPEDRSGMPVVGPLVPVPEPVDPAVLVAEARESGRQEGAAAARAEFERQRAADDARHAEELAESRRRWCEEESDRLAAALTAGLAGIETAIAASVGRILAPFLGEQVRRAAIDELAATLGPLLADGDGPTMVVRGPADLLDRLRPKLSAHAGAVVFGETAAAADIVVGTGDTVVETRIAEWLARLAAAVE